MERSMPDSMPKIRDVIEAGNVASVALHKWTGFEQPGVPREVRWKFDLRKQLSRLDSA
jgi:L-amino acid N-acyltransferase YncA